MGTISMGPTNPPRTEKPTPSSPLRDLYKCYSASDSIGSCGACLLNLTQKFTEPDFTPELYFDVVNACDCPVCLEEESAWLSTGKCMKKNKDSKMKVQKTKKETKVKSAKLPKGQK